MPKGVYKHHKMDAEQRFWSYVGPHDDPTKCWLWLGGYFFNHRGRELQGSRYGRINIDGVYVLVHRFAYELLVGPIHKGMTIDHVKSRGCTSTLCVNPAHLEVVTMKVNILRGDSVCALNARKTHCVHGHPFDKVNTTVNKQTGSRGCRICAKLNMRKVRGQRENTCV
jgi:hypothetical protein